MFGVGRQALETVGDEFPQGTDVLVLRGQHAYGFCFLLPVVGAIPQSGLGQDAGVLDSGKQLLFHSQCGANALLNGSLVEVGVGDGGEEVQGDEVVDFSLHTLPLGPQSRGDGG